ncbi:MAG: heavy metal translocating P-type ATPase [Lysobacter sp.]
MAFALDAAINTAGTATQAIAPACFHCAEPLPPNPVQVATAGLSRAYCCAGCAAAAQWIEQAHLGDYYQLRSQPAARVGTDAIDLSAWDRDDVLADHARDVDGGREIVLLTDGMRCAACAWLIDRALSRAAGVTEVCANAVTGRIRITWQPQRTPLSAVLRVLVSLGFRPYLASGEGRERERRAARNRDLLRLGLAGLGAMQAMMFAEALYLDTRGQMPLPTRDFFRWITFLVSTPVVFYAGWPFLAGAWRELCHRRLGMDTLIATSTLLAYFASVVETLRGGPHVWYDAAVMFVFLLLAARMLEQRARNTANAQVDALARARPALATRERGDGTRETVPVSALAIDDVACIAAGDAVPADGVLLDGTASFEEALLTGEARPVDKPAGAAVYAGTVCRMRPARLRITHVGAATRLSQLVRLVDQAQAHRPAQARVADRIAGHFVLVLLLAAVAVYASWRVHDPTRAFEVTLALLVISCPCALSLSVPAALAAAHGALAKLGMLATRPDALDTLARATDVVFDKTGTLSDSHPGLDAVATFDDVDAEQALAIAAALERDSAHPIASAFAHVASGATACDLVAREVEEHPGRGIEGNIDGRRWRLGQAAFACGGDTEDARLWLSDGHRAIACFTLRESMRADARAAVDQLRVQGLDLHLSSGDAEAPVAQFARQLGIADAAARQTPEAKLARVRELQQAGRVVVMVGDGLNDAPVLAGADVSIAVADGTALAQRAADFVTTGGSLLRIPAAVALARRTRRIIRQNLAWAIAYNVLALPLAAAGLVTPWLAALGMAVSSLTVTLNALRLTRTPASKAGTPARAMTRAPAR